MRIISIGSTFEHKSVHNGTFHSTLSLLDYDLVIWDQRYTLNEYSADYPKGTYMGLVCLNDDSSIKIVEDIKRRNKEMLEMLKIGRFIIVFTPPPNQFYRATGEKQYSGTGRNRATTRIVTKDDVINTLPVKIKTVAAAGENIECRGHDPFLNFWKSNHQYLFYEAYFDEIVGKPLFFIRDTDKVVGSVVEFENGHIIFIPSFVNILHFNTRKEWLPIQRKFIDSIINLIESLKKDAGDFELPNWSAQYLLPQEQEERDSLKNLEEEL
ncbi:MAG: hypothetical protein LUQ65_00235, partial [Candidatus Helarchaeota archaeon]|nr:hypothetical protein [Candidatus Helarchaeota archaeon]